MTKRSLSVDRLKLGVCYYPEQWDEARWPDDFCRMRELGLSLVRMGEFAWTIFEPREGRFSFDLFDRALDLAGQHDLAVILGTPTATPPAWLTHRYPDTLNVSRDGVQYQHGQRRHYNYNASIYRDLSARIVTQMAEHYRDHPAVVGWQIDNEINCEMNVFYSAADHAAFRTWLHARYGSLERLNQAWGTVFWNQTYTDWDQVHLTRPTVSDSPNPHQALDEKRFISDSAASFVKLQADILRHLAPKQWITTNGLFGHLDSHRMAEDSLDFLSYDSYPSFSTILPEDGSVLAGGRQWSLNLSTVRDVSPRFCVMEQQSGANGWVNRMNAPSPKPGQLRLWTYQSVAHGADAVLYFRWRTAAMGTEIYWHGINDWSNLPNRRVAEVQRVGAEFASVGDLVAGTEFQATVGMLRDYDNEWDGELDSCYGPLARRSTGAWYKVLQHRHIPADVVCLRPGARPDDLARYRLLVYPHPAIMTEQTAAVLSEYVQGGGRLVFGCRSGYKDAEGHCPMQQMPGPVADLCGVRVEDFTLIGPRHKAPALVWADDVKGAPATADGFNDILAVTSGDAAVLARYAEDYYAGSPALVCNRRGAGAAYYYGAAFCDAVAEALLDHCGVTSPAEGLMTLPPEVELCIRRSPKSGASLWFLLNYSGSAQPLELHGGYIDVLSGQAVGGSTTLAPYDVIILRQEGS